MSKVSFKKFWEIMCGKNDKGYDNAVKSLNKIYKQVNRIGMKFPDVHSFDFEVVKNTWKPLPTDVATRVETMGLHIEDNYRSVICHYGTFAEILPHKHSNEWEIIQVLEGSIYDTFTDTTLQKGDVYIIPRGMEHHIISKEEECYMYILFTEHKEHLVIPHTEPNLAKEFISKRKLTQPQKIQ